MNVEKLAQLGLKHKISYISKDPGHIKNSSEKLQANSDFNSDSISISDEAKEIGRASCRERV